MLLYSLIALWFSREGHRHYPMPHRSWYIGKSHASLADMLATLRCQRVKQEAFSMHLHGSGSRSLLKCLIHAVQQAG